MNRPKRPAPILTGGNLENSFDLSFEASGGDVFRKEGYAIHSNGLVKEGENKRFTVVFEDLEIGKVIGQGCSSVVCMARHISSNTLLALKVIKMHDKSNRHQLINEINFLYDAECDTLIHFWGAFYREGAITIALEYMDGGSLANVLEQCGPIPEGTLANVTYQILWGLAYLKHEKRLHRDIKPSNLLIDSRGQVKITDFGISAELQNSIAMCGTFVGTFKYMSPERIRSEQYSYASDVWSLGISLMEVATGRYPYTEEKTAIDMVQTMLESDTPRLDSSKFSHEFCRFIECCLQKNHRERWQADRLLDSPWLKRWGATSLSAAAANVKRWIET